MNKIILVGGLTRDSELKYLPGSGTPVCNFSMGVKRDFKDKKTGKYESDYFNVQVFGKFGEVVAQYTEKGSQVAVCGRLEKRSYEKDGQKRTVDTVMADTVQFLSQKKSSGNQSAPQKQEDNSTAFGEDDSSKDIPF